MILPEEGTTFDIVVPSSDLRDIESKLSLVVTMAEINYRDYFFYIATFTLIVSIGFYILNRKKLPDYFRYLAGFLGMHLILDFIAHFLSRAAIPNLPLLHLYTMLEFVLLGLFYRNLLRAPEWLHQYFLWFFYGGVAIIIGNTLFLQSPFEFNSYAKTFSNVSIIILALLYFYNAVLGLINPFYRSGLNFINAGIFIFYMGTLLIFLFSDFLRRNDQDILFEIWNVNLILSILLQVLLLLGLIWARQGAPSTDNWRDWAEKEALSSKRN